jgi:hypothetical protein
MTKAKIGPMGKPVVSAKKTPFQGYKTEVARGSGPFVDAGFSTSRDYEIPLDLPSAGQVETRKIRIQYRLNNAPSANSATCSRSTCADAEPKRPLPEVASKRRWSSGFSLRSGATA